MELTLLKSKIHMATLTGTELYYTGSICIDQNLLDAAGILEGEQVHVVNLNNGERLITYAIAGKRGSGVIELNGPAARLGMVCDKVIIITYAKMSDAEAKTYKPVVVHVNGKNKIQRKKK